MIFYHFYHGARGFTHPMGFDLRQLALRHQHQLGQLRTRVEPIPSRHHGFPYENGLRNLDDLGVPIFGNLEIYGNHWFEGKNYTTLQHNFFPQKMVRSRVFFSEFSP